MEVGGAAPTQPWAGIQKFLSFPRSLDSQSVSRKGLFVFVFLSKIICEQVKQSCPVRGGGQSSRELGVRTPPHSLTLQGGIGALPCGQTALELSPSISYQLVTLGKSQTMLGECFLKEGMNFTSLSLASISGTGTGT